MLDWGLRIVVLLAAPVPWFLLILPSPQKRRCSHLMARSKQ